MLDSAAAAGTAGEAAKDDEAVNKVVGSGASPRGGDAAPNANGAAEEGEAAPLTPLSALQLTVEVLGTISGKATVREDRTLQPKQRDAPAAGIPGFRV